MKLWGKKEPEIVRIQFRHLQFQEDGTPKGSHSLKQLEAAASFSTINRHSIRDLRTIFLNSPLIFAGIHKKSKDMSHAWFEWEAETPEYIVKTTNRWRSLLQRIIKESLINAYWSGDGKVEKIYDEKDVSGVDKAPTEGAKLINLRCIDPMTIVGVKKGFLEIQGYDKNDRLTTRKMHPQRYLSITPHPMGDYERGVSPIDVSYNLALSMMNADKSYGEYVYRVGNGFMVLNIDQANQKEIDDAYDHMKKIQKGFVGSERHVFDVKTPLSFEPREFNFYFYRGLARVLEMPVSMFIGQNTGDVDIRDDRGEYYSAIKSTQETLLNPFVKSVISELLGIKKEIANYRIIWNDIYVDVRTQGEAMRFMASSIRMLSMALIEQKEEELDFITIEEARNILGLPPRIPDTDYPQEPPEDDPEEEKKEHTTGFLKKRDKQGMEQMKKFAKKEREIGEKIIREQNNDNI
jgi:hypothetical protein